jgi:hypothetical protein
MGPQADARPKAAFRAFRRHWQRHYGPMVQRLQRDLPELLSFYSFPRHLWKNLRTTNIIERCFRRGAPPHPTDGLLCQRGQCRPHHLLHLPAL